MMQPSLLSLFCTVQGGRSCPVRSAPASPRPRNCATASRPWPAPAPHPRRWPSVAASSCGPPPPSTRPTKKSPLTWTATATRSASGASALLPTAWPACKMPRGPVGRGLFPPQDRVAVVSLASASTADHDCPATRWTLDDLARQLVRLAGFREGEDVDIVFTGLRPGEKLHEELHSQAEQARMTRRERILLWDLAPEDESSLRAQVSELERVAVLGDAASIRAALRVLVPEYSDGANGGAPS